MLRKIGTSARAPTSKSAARVGKKSTESSTLAMMHPPPPGEGKRGEQGYLAYLLRQAQAAARLAMERALADLGVTPPQFVAPIPACPAPISRGSRC
jgi:hypothetical protein